MKYILWKQLHMIYGNNFMDMILNTHASIQVRMPRDLKLFITSAKSIRRHFVSLELYTNENGEKTENRLKTAKVRLYNEKAQI